MNCVNSVGIACVLYVVLRVCFGFTCALFIYCDFVYCLIVGCCTDSC